MISSFRLDMFAVIYHYFDRIYMPHAGAKFLSCKFSFWNWLFTSSLNAQSYLKIPFDNSVAADALTFTSPSAASELTNIETNPQHSYYRIHNCKIARLLIHTDRVILIPQLYTVDPNCRKKMWKTYMHGIHTFYLLHGNQNSGSFKNASNWGWMTAIYQSDPPLEQTRPDQTRSMHSGSALGTSVHGPLLLMSIYFDYIHY